MANEVAFSIISQGRCHEHVLKSMVEAGAIPYLVKLLIQDQISSRTLLTKLVEHEEDISQLLSAHLLPALRGRIKEWFTLFDHYTSLLRRLTPTASVNQLLPLFAFLFHWAFFDEVSCCHSLCVVDVQESVGIADLLFDLIKDRSYTEEVACRYVPRLRATSGDKKVADSLRGRGQIHSYHSLPLRFFPPSLSPATLSHRIC
jgi:hypothetical protein